MSRASTTVSVSKPTENPDGVTGTTAAAAATATVSSDSLPPLLARCLPSSLVPHLLSLQSLITYRMSRLHSAGKAAAYISLSIIVLFVALSNTITRILGSMWSDVGNNWAVLWGMIESLHLSPPVLYLGLSISLHMVVFWCYSTFLMWFDKYPSRHALSKYKIQPTKNVPLLDATWWKAVKVVLRNQVIVGFPMACLTYPISMWRGMSMTLPLPSFEVFVRDIVIFIFVEEVMFYYSHRLLHHPKIYGYMHKIHHEFTAPVGVAALYCHPFEHAVSNMLPVYMGPILMGSHFSVALVWQTIAVLNSISTHSGYHLPLMPSPQAHDYHHLMFNENFGVLGLLDWIHETDKKFRASNQYKRHKTYLDWDEFAEIGNEQPTLVRGATVASEKKKQNVDGEFKSAASSAVGASSSSTSSSVPSDERSLGMGGWSGVASADL